MSGVTTTATGKAPPTLTVCNVDDDGIQTEIKYDDDDDDDNGKREYKKSASFGGFHDILKHVSRKLSHPFGGRTAGRSRRFFF